MSVCDDLIRAAYGDEGDKLSAAEIKKLKNALVRAAKEKRALDPSVSSNDALTVVADEFAQNAERQAMIRKRDEILNLKAFLIARDTIRTKFKDDPAAGFKALVVGIQNKTATARGSTALEIDALERYYFAGVLDDVSAVDGGVALFSEPGMALNIARALWALGTDGAKLDGFDPRALALARAIQKWQEVARTDANKAGAWIGKLPGYIVTQSHDSMKILADKLGWMAMMRQRADLPRMMAETGAESVEELLESIYNGLASGVHLKSPGAPKNTGGPSLRGMSKGVSQERVIHFKSADDWFEYNAEFGANNMYEAVLGGLKNMARATGVMRKLGPNHESTVARLIDSIKEDLRDQPAKARAFNQTSERYLKWYVKEVDGSLDIPGNDTLATWGAGIRAIQNMASLGGSLLASVGDLGVMMVGAKHLGENGFSTVAKGVGRMFRGVPKGERLHLYADLGLALESMLGKFATSRFSVDDGVPGALGEMQKTFFTLNGQNRWTDAMRSSIAEFISMTFARRAATAFDDLPADLRSTMGLYGLDAGKWDIIRAGTLQELDGSRFLVPSGIRDLPDEVFSKYLTDKGFKASDAAVRKLRDEIQGQMRMLFVDQNQYMLIGPDAATRGLMKAGTQKGTPIGEAMRLMMQFKSFTIAFSQRTIGREYKHNGMMGIARMLAYTTVAGYAAMYLKDLAKGKTPRDPFDPRTAVAAMQQGGGMGIYGDLLFSQVIERRAQDATIQFLGPTAADVAAVLNTGARAISGNDPSAAAVRLAQQNIPFANLFYGKLLLDYLIFWNLQEAVNPGSLARMEREMQDRSGQQLMVNPQARFPDAPEIRQ
jgi:hypothetical protein